MEKVNYFVFNVTLYLRTMLHSIIAIFSKAKSDQYWHYVQRTVIDFGCKAVQKKWYHVLYEKMKLFSKSSRFRKVLITSEIDNSFIVLLLKKLYESPNTQHLENKEIEMMVACRSFDDVDQFDMYNFRRTMIFSSITCKKEIIKLYYTKSFSGEMNDNLAQELVKIFGDDYEFISLLVDNGSSPVLKNFFIRKTLFSLPTPQGEIKLKEFVRKKSLAGCNICLYGSNPLLREMRSYLTSSTDIEKWENYLLSCETDSVIRCEAAKYGLQSTTIKKLLKLNKSQH